jgi:hypothetical protein
MSVDILPDEETMLGQSYQIVFVAGESKQGGKKNPQRRKPLWI